MINNFWLYFNTIRFLSFRQIYFRIINIFLIKRLNYAVSPIIRNFTSSLIVIDRKKHIFTAPNNIKIHQKDFIINSNFDWCKNSYTKLDIYNLHYLDFLSEYEESNAQFFENMIICWIDSNKNIREHGWDPYPTSLRLVNLVKWHLKSKCKNKKILNSIYLQARWLNQNIEYHISGNHVIANAKALLFSGLLFNNKESFKWYLKGLNLFTRSLNIQINDDGGHYERSPMYHSIITEDILDVLNTISASGNIVEVKVLNVLKKKLIDCISYYSYLCHPDDLPAFFGDTNYDSSLSKSYLQEYIFLMYPKWNLEKAKNTFCTELNKSGYCCVKNKNIYLISDIGDTRDLDQPGHTHAALLSYEVSLFNKRFIVNSGISTYSENKQREYERSTKAHNTVEIGLENSQEVWKSFRLGRRAKVFDKEINSNNKEIKISIKHNGYSKFIRDKNIIHKRTWEINENELVVTDKIFGNYDNAISRIYFHPDIEITKKNTLKMPNGKIVTFQVYDNNYSIINSVWYPKYNVALENKLLEIKLCNNYSKVKFQLI